MYAIRDYQGNIIVPQYNYNDMPEELTPGKGYQIKMTEPFTLLLSGYSASENCVINIPEGWSTFGTLDSSDGFIVSICKRISANHSNICDFGLQQIRFGRSRRHSNHVSHWRFYCNYV